MHAVINAANERALTTVTLNVHHENARARSLYEQLGFTYIDRTSMSETRRMRLRLPTT
jgi:ribosomal protein S18 acetylase RimI-like enzyme